MLPPNFNVTVGRCQDTVRVVVEGELDLATAPLLADHLDAVAGADGCDVVLDLARVTFLDSAGVALLLGAAKRAAREGWPLTIAGVAADVRKTLEICGVLELLPLLDERSLGDPLM